MRSASAAASADRQDAQPCLLRLGLGLRPGAQPDADVDPGVGQVQGVGVSLGPVADDRHLAALDQAGSASDS